VRDRRPEKRIQSCKSRDIATSINELKESTRQNTVFNIRDFKSGGAGDVVNKVLQG
jgi:hypothetical protein